MSRIIFIMVSTFLILVQSTAAQEVPGYLGKRLSVAAGTDLAPITGAFLGEKPVYAMQPKLLGSVQYVTGKATELLIYGEYGRDLTEVPEAAGSENMLPVINRLYATGISMRFYNFKGAGAIAPLGSYRSMELGFAWAMISDDGSYLASGQKRLGGSQSYMLGFGVGKQAIFYDRFLFDYGARFLVTPTTYSVLSEVLLQDGNDDSMSRFDKRGLHSLFTNFMLTVYFKFGTIVY